MDGNGGKRFSWFILARRRSDRSFGFHLFDIVLPNVKKNVPQSPGSTSSLTHTERGNTTTAGIRWEKKTAAKDVGLSFASARSPLHAHVRKPECENASADGWNQVCLRFETGSTKAENSERNTICFSKASRGKGSAKNPSRRDLLRLDISSVSERDVANVVAQNQIVMLLL